MRYFLLCLLLASCALSPERAKQMSQEDLCYTAGDATDKATYQSAIGELKHRGLGCDRWINHIAGRQRWNDVPYHPRNFMRCDLSDGTAVYCSAASDSNVTLITPIGLTNTAIPPMYMIIK
jgi:hypothetical protein